MYNKEWEVVTIIEKKVDGRKIRGTEFGYYLSKLF